MSQIVLFLPGNLFHSNITQAQIRRLLKEKAGMEALRNSGAPVVFGWQMIDWLLAPDIYKLGPHELCAGSYSHVLHNLLDDEDSAWQSANGIKDEVLELLSGADPVLGPRLVRLLKGLSGSQG